MPQDDDRTYQGEGFAGRRLGEPAPQAPSPTKQPEEQGSAANMAQTAPQAQGGTTNVGQLMAAIAGVILMLGAFIVLQQGVFDSTQITENTYSQDDGDSRIDGRGMKTFDGVTASDCPAIQRVVDSMAGSDLTSTSMAVAVQVLNDDPTIVPPGGLAHDGAVALLSCNIDVWTGSGY